jgi:RNA polymerase sigma-70 factor, ECF subfamily
LIDPMIDPPGRTVDESRGLATPGHEIVDRAHVGTEMHAHALAPPSDPDPIAALLQEGRHRDALAACARSHGAVLGRLCMALLGSQADADEATQETLLRAHRGMASYRGEGSIKAWLCGIARHVCAHMLESRRKGRELLEIVPPSDEPEARDLFACRQRARAIRDALEHLKPSEREALVLRYVADLSHREIASACNIDEAAARKRISRALARLRTVMPDEVHP